MRSRALVALAALALLGTRANPVGAAATGTVAGTVQVSPIAVVLALSSTSAHVGDAVAATATVTNLTTVAIKVVVVELRLDATGLRVKPAGSLSIQLKAGKAGDAKWTVCGARAGSYVIVARATVNGVSIDSAARLLTVTTGGRKTCP